jgi:site-specific recombinase XerD
MRTHNPENERIKRAYLGYLKEARRLSEHSIDAAAAALSRFEQYTKYRDFKSFHIQQAVGFKRKLADRLNERTGERLSSSTLYASLNALRAFFQWLAGQPGYRSRLTFADADYFALSEKESRIAKATRDRFVPTVDQVLHVVRTMPSNSDIEFRDRAVVAFILLTGVRDGALASLKLKHVNLQKKEVVQDAREVRTKFSKTFTTWFFPVGEDIEQIIGEWVEHLRRNMQFGDGDPLFPATRVAIGQDKRFRADGLSRTGWSNAASIRRIFEESFMAAGLPHTIPHSIRKTLAQLGERVCITPEEFKAWSQNLGHEQVLTTFSSYGQVSSDRQAELMRGLAARPDRSAPNAVAIDQAIRLLQDARQQAR